MNYVKYCIVLVEHVGHLYLYGFKDKNNTSVFI